MSQHNLHRLIVKIAASFIAIFLYGCTETIELDTNDAKPVIVIYGVLTDVPSYQEIQISSSTGYFDNKPNPRISDAIVSITSEEGTEYVLQEVDTVPGLYRTSVLMSGIPGKTYTLEVKTDFDGDGTGETYSAEAKMEEKAMLDSIDITTLDMMGYEFFSVNVYMQDPAAKNYYFVRYQINDSLYSKISRSIVFDDLGVENQYIEGASIGLFPDWKEKDKYTEDDAHVMAFMRTGDAIRLQLFCASKGYYNFLLQCQKEIVGENPFFGGPLSNVATNLSNGAAGYFAACTLSEKQAIAPVRK